MIFIAANIIFFIGQEHRNPQNFPLLIPQQIFIFPLLRQHIDKNVNLVTQTNIHILIFLNIFTI